MSARGFCTCKRDHPGNVLCHPAPGTAWHYLCDKPAAPWPVEPCTDHAMTGPDHDPCPRIVPTGTGWPS